MPNLYRAAADIDSLERLASNYSSAIHRLHPMLKLIATLFYIVIAASFKPAQISGLILFIAFPAICFIVAKIPSGIIIRRLLPALPFAFFLAAGNLIIIKPLEVGLFSCVSIFIKTMLTVSAVTVLVATTSFDKISAQLYRLRVPKIFCLQFVMCYRYISVLLSETESMYTAYTLRLCVKGVKLKDMGVFVGQLLLRSFDRAGRVYQAMKCRGFDGVYRTAARDKLSLKNILCLSGLICIMTVIRILSG
ncbi:MAG: cobalt ECF transporter T component CbiQ [Clostridiales bacterium]|jgi:cobalt/nickel transport system permease protein|nr:cobalt ECF transporter T component CbiQ [Clostridiales bacterium]